MLLQFVYGCIHSVSSSFLRFPFHRITLRMIILRRLTGILFSPGAADVFQYLNRHSDPSQHTKSELPINTYHELWIQSEDELRDPPFRAATDLRYVTPSVLGWNPSASESGPDIHLPNVIYAKRERSNVIGKSNVGTVSSLNAGCRRVRSTGSGHSRQSRWVFVRLSGKYDCLTIDYH